MLFSDRQRKAIPYSFIKTYLRVALICFLPRLIYSFLCSDNDPHLSLYWNLSTGLLRYGTLGYQGEPTTVLEPLYPVLLAFFRWLSGDHFFVVVLMQIFIGVIGCIYLYELALFLSGSKTAANIASSIFSFYPYFIRQSVLMTEVQLFMTLLIISTYYFGQATDFRKALRCGFFFGLTALARVMILPVWGLATLAFAAKKRFSLVLVLIAGTSAVTLPFFWRNHQIDGSVLPTRSGWNLLEGNCKYSDKFLPKYNLDLLDRYVFELLEQERPDLSNENNKKKIDDFFTQKAFQFIKENPFRVLKLKLLNVVYFFCPRIVPFYQMDDKTKLVWVGDNEFTIEHLVSRGHTREWVHSICYSFILLTSLAGFYLRRKNFREDMLLYFIVIGFTAVYSVYWPSTRLRMPMEFVLMFYSACATAELTGRWKLRVSHESANHA